MKCLVTGGAGFIGSHVQDRLVELGFEVAVFDNLSAGKKEYINPKTRFFEGDIRSPLDLDKAFSEFKPEIVFHLAGQIEVSYSMAHPKEDEEINVHGTMNVLDACVKNGVKKIVHTTTGGAFYGDVDFKDLPIKEDQPINRPTSFYGVAKNNGENYVKLFGNIHGLKWVSLRYANVYGPRQDENKEAGVIAIFTNKLLKKEQPTINGDGKHTRDYVYVGDVVEANIKAIDHPDNDYFNISTGVATANLQVFQNIERELKTGIEVAFGPPRPGDALHVTLDPTKAKEKLGFEPKVDFKQGVHLTAQYYLDKKGEDESRV